MDVGEVVPTLVGEHSLVESIRLTGSRASGAVHDLSDWDFLVRTRDFARLAAELPSLVKPVAPLAGQWDRYSHHACYMLMLRGPTKIDLIFPDEKQERAGPWQVSAETLEAIDRHFWDWILWLEQKRRSGQQRVLESSLADMQRLMLGPMDSTAGPGSVAEAVEVYLGLREQLEQRYRVRVPRLLEREVRPVVYPDRAPV